MRWVRNEKLMLESRPDEWSIDARARDANRHFQQSDQLAIAWACVTTNLAIPAMHRHERLG